MPLIQLPAQAWTRQPQQLARVNRKGPLSAGLKYAYSPGFGAAVNAVDGHLTDMSPVGRELTRIRNGRKVWYGGNSEGFTEANISGLTYPFTLFALISTDNVTTNGSAISIFKMGAGGGGIYLGVGTDYAGTNFPRLNINGTVVDASTKQLVNTPRVIASVSYSATSHELFVDGVSMGTSGATGPTIDNTFSIGGLYARDASYGYLSLSAGGNLADCGIYNRALPIAEIKKQAENLWQIFQRKPRAVWVASAGGGGATISLGAAGFQWAKGSPQVGLRNTFTGALVSTSANSAQVKLQSALTLSSLPFLAKAVQAKLQQALSVSSLTLLAKATQTRLTVGLSVAGVALVAWVVSVSGAVAILARLLSLMGVGS